MNARIKTSFPGVLPCRGVLLILFTLLAAQPGRAQSNWIAALTGTTVDLKMIDFTTPLDGYVVGSGGTILKTTDLGITWQPLNSTVTEDLWSLRFTTSDVGYAGGDGGIILKTTDRGGNWMKLSTGLKNGALHSFIFGIHTLSDNFIYAVGGDGEVGEGVVLTSTDAGATWKKTLVPEAFFLDRCWFITSKIGFAVGLSTSGGGVIVKTTDGGATWTQQHAAGMLIVSVQALDATTVVAVGSGGGIYRSTDEGETWNSISSGTSNDLLDLFFTSDKNGMAAGDNGRVLNTTDGGLTWKSQTIDGGGFLNDIFSFPEGTSLVAGSSGRLFLSGVPSAVPAPGSDLAVTSLISPDPLRTISTFKLSGLIDPERYRLTIYDIQGNEQRRHRIDADGMVQIERGEMTAGRYFYRVVGEGEVVGRGSFAVE